jgi:hypothetical protein
MHYDFAQLTTFIPCATTYFGFALDFAGQHLKNALTGGLSRHRQTQNMKEYL